MPWILGGVGALALTSGVVLDLIGTSELDELRDTCAPFCDDGDLDAARYKILAGDGLIVVGVGLGVALGWWLLTRPSSPPASTGRGPQLHLGKLTF